jgi:hypothetical protein
MGIDTRYRPALRALYSSVAIRETYDGGAE